MQLLAVAYGGHVERLKTQREGEIKYEALTPSPLITEGAYSAYFSHQDIVVDLPPGFSLDATSDGLIAAFHSNHYNCYGVQFHPECSESRMTRNVISRFLQIAVQRQIPFMDCRISRPEYNSIAMSLGTVSITKLAQKLYLSREVIQAVWNRFREQFRIPAILA